MAKLDGTNGLIQQYDYQTPTTGFTYTFASGTQTLVMNPAGTLATGTITMPAAPADGMVVTIESTQAITALTVQGNTGQSLVGAPARIYPNQPESFIYRITNTTWYPYSTARSAVLQVVQATYNTTTSTTSTSFVTSNLSASITPTSSTSKVLVFLSSTVATANGSTSIPVTLYRGGTNVAGGTTPITDLVTSGNNWSMNFNYLDSPATTSATTYTFYFRSGNGSLVYTNLTGYISSLILMEIAA